MIFYLCHPYALYTDKEQPWEYAIDWVRKLRKMGKVVFSPIMHTHCYVKYTDYDEDYLAWDLALMEGWLNHDRTIISKCPVCDSELHYYDGIGLPDTDACCADCWNKGMADGFSDPFEHGQWKVNDLNWGYDSGLTVVMSEYAVLEKWIDCLDWCYQAHINEEDICAGFESNVIEWKDMWRSQGCRREYEFAKEHHIRVLSLEAFLDGKEVEL